MAAADQDEAGALRHVPRVQRGPGRGEARLRLRGSPLRALRRQGARPLAGRRAGRVLVPVHAALQCLCYAATALVACAFIRWYMAVDGVYVVEFDPPPELLAVGAVAAAAEQVQPPSPPPPAMDMC